MQKSVTGIIVMLALATAAPAANLASEDSRCTSTDTVCREFEKLAEAEQYEKIIEKFDSGKQYSEASRNFIGQAYLSLASRDGVTPEQEEAYYRKALEVNHYIAYMGLYFFYAQKDREKALSFLRQYVETKPADPVPYVILGESEFARKNYALANTYLREAKKVAHAHSANLDWLLFQVSYLLKDYAYAGEMLESVAKNGKIENELKSLLSDSRFEGIEKRPEFRKYRDLFREARTRS